MSITDITSIVTKEAFGIWFLIGAALVFFMQAGFAMVETGFTRAKNAGNIIMKNLMDFCIGTVVFVLLGFSLMMAEDYVCGFIGVPNLKIFTDFGGFLEDGMAPSFVFNLVFCATAATIVSGSMAERTKFISYCIYSGVISLFVYPIEAGWVWNSQGWLVKLGFHDFAGSAAIHSVGGITALIGAILVGPRLGKYVKDKSGKVTKVNAIPGHAITLGALGCFILWFGWYGFNGAAAWDGNSLASIFVTTTIAPAVATCTTLLYTWIKNGKPDVSMCLNASLAGLVGITAGCDALDALGASIVGIVSGILVVIVVEVLDLKCHVDDPVGAVGVHFANGIWGTIAVGLLANPKAPAGLEGLFYTGSPKLLGIQALGIAEGALERTVAYTKERKQFGRSIAQFQNTQFQLADMATKVEAAKMLVYKAAMTKDQYTKDHTTSYSVEAAMAKLYAAEVAMEVTTKAVQLHGGYGYIREYEVERMMRDAKITEIYEGTSEVQRMVISANLLK